jgi:hypothetical protein
LFLAAGHGLQGHLGKNGSMTDPSQIRKRAIVMMSKALLLLDDAGENIAAAHLQFAIDIAAKSNPIKRDQYGPNLGVN